MKSNFFSNKIILSLAALFCCALWGISTPIVKLGYNYIDAASVPSLLLWAGIQFVLAGILTILVYSLISKKIALPKRKSIVGILKISVFQTVLQYTFLYIGLCYTTSAKGAIIKSTDVFFIMLIASLIFKQEKLTAKKIFSCIIGFAGIIVVNLNGLSFNINPLGDFLVLLGIFFYSFAVVITKPYSQKEKPFVICGYQMTFGGIIMLIIGIVFGGTMDYLGMLPVILVLSAIYAVSYSLWTVLLKYNPVSKVSIHSFMTPIFGVVFSGVILNEESNISPLNLVISLLLISAGIILWSTNKECR